VDLTRAAGAVAVSRVAPCLWFTGGAAESLLGTVKPDLTALRTAFDSQLSA